MVIKNCYRLQRDLFNQVIADFITIFAPGMEPLNRQFYGPSMRNFYIGRFTELNVKQALTAQQLHPILSEYDWGDYHLFAIYSY